MQLLFKSAKAEAGKSEAPRRRNDSRTRDHLANERTYLAWMRTAIALLGFGVVIVRLRAFQIPMNTTPGNGWKLGLVFSLVGLITVLISTRQYFSVQHDIDADTYEPADRLIILFSTIVVLLGAGVIYFIFTAPLNSQSPVVFE